MYLEARDRFERPMVRHLKKVVDEGDAVLVLAERFDENEAAVCRTLLQCNSPGQKNLLSISVAQPARARHEQWHTSLDAEPANSSIIDVRISDPLNELESSSSQLGVETIRTSADLTELAIQIQDYTDEWPTESKEYQTIVCFHSITSLLQYINIQDVFKFVSHLTNRLNEVGAITHYHMDPGAHSTQTVEKYVGRLDITCKYVDGELSVLTGKLS